MKQFLLILALGAVAIVAISSAPVAAQQVNVSVENSTATPSSSAECETIDNSTRLCSAKLVDGTAVLELKSDELQKVTVTDAGAMMRGGEIPRQEFLLRPGETTRIEFDVYTGGSMAGVTIDTGEVLWGEPLDKPSRFLSGDVSTSDVQAAGITGIAMTGVMTLAIAWKRRKGVGSEPEQIA